MQLKTINRPRHEHAFTHAHDLGNLCEETHAAMCFSGVHQF